MVTPELVPLIKVGGLADVVGSLSKALASRGHDVRIVLPKYAGLEGVESAVPLETPLIVHLGGHESYAQVWELPLPDSSARCYLLEHNLYFDSTDVYCGPSGDESDNFKRFTFLSRAAIDLCNHLDWMPEVIHCHDWPTGLIPVYLNTTEQKEPIGRAASVMTLHNMQHQGYCPSETISFAGLPQSTFRADSLEAMGQVNMLKGAIYHATKISTVSPTYAREIQDREGYGLQHILHYRAADLIGVINGVDLTEWCPSTDPLIPQTYGIDALSGKGICKAELQKAFGLEQRPEVPLFSVVSRLVEQKGLDLLIKASERLMEAMDIQIVVLGTGDPTLEDAFKSLASKYPERYGAKIGFDNKLAHLCAAGADFLCMPSRFEPCGLSQMYAMIYGTPPIVRATGGLIDSVEPYVEGTKMGTGFLFKDATAEALYDTIGWACSTYYDRPDEYKMLQKNGMTKDFSWDHSADRYESIYTWAIGARKASYEAL